MDFFRPAGGSGFAALRPAGLSRELPLKKRQESRARFAARRFSISRPAVGAFFAPLRGTPDVPPSAAEIAGSRPGGGSGFAALRPAGLSRELPLKKRQELRARSAARRFSISRPAVGAFFALLRGAPDVPPSAAEIAGSRPGGGSGFAALRPAGLSRELPLKKAARNTSAFRRAARVPFRTDEKEPKVRLRGLRRPLRNPLERLASTRRLQPLPTGTQAEGSIQVAGAPNDRSQRARREHPAENNARSGRSRALRARAAVPPGFPPPHGRCAPRKSGRASTNALSVLLRRLSGRGIAPAARRQAGCWTPAN